MTSEPVCVLTRLEFHSLRHWFRAVLMFRHLVALAGGVDGSVLARRALPEWNVLVIISLWKSEQAMIRFTGLEEHVNASRWTLKVGARVWSAVFDARGASSMSQGWIADLDPWITRELTGPA